MAKKKKVAKSKTVKNKKSKKVAKRPTKKAKAIKLNGIVLKQVDLSAYYNVRNIEGQAPGPSLPGPIQLQGIPPKASQEYQMATHEGRADINGNFSYHPDPNNTPDRFETSIYFSEAGFLYGMDNYHQGRYLTGDKKFTLFFTLKGAFLNTKYDINLIPTLTKKWELDDHQRGVNHMKVKYRVKLNMGNGRVRGPKPIVVGVNNPIKFSRVGQGTHSLLFDASEFEVTVQENGNRGLFSYILNISLSINISLPIKKR